MVGPAGGQLRRKLRQQVRPVALHDAADFVVDGADVVESLYPLADHFKFVRTERATVQKFHRHGSAPPPAGGSACSLTSTGIGALPGHHEDFKPSTRLPTDTAQLHVRIKLSVFSRYVPIQSRQDNRSRALLLLLLYYPPPYAKDREMLL